MGSHAARSEVRIIMCTEHSITFSCGKYTIAGVYFPPFSMTDQEVAGQLSQVQHASLILGDVNVRFPDRKHQSGQPGPPGRLAALQEWMARFSFAHIKPSIPRLARQKQMKLTTDHCFAAQKVQDQISLQLYNNKRLRMESDHTYTIGVIMTLGQEQEKEDGKDITRFCIRGLQDKEKQRRLKLAIARMAEEMQQGDGVDELDRHLVKLCQRAQTQVIGRAKQRPIGRDGVHRKGNGLRCGLSVRFYKEASKDSEENNVMCVTDAASQEGIDVVTENLRILRQRWTGKDNILPRQEEELGATMAWSKDEIRRQDPHKACGADGIHIRFLKAMEDTAGTSWLYRLYMRCLETGRTPERWNKSEIYLLTKDVSKARNANNVRPISIICIFRKVFERLLLRQSEGARWARLHPAQAGFRRDYSVYANAAVVHALLSSGRRSTAICLDLRSAFDMVDHGLLYDKLCQRGCPRRLLSILRCLMMTNLKSRLLINGEVTDWFPRTRGVLQGSPLSPWLFNIFIDDLLAKVNEGVRGVPICLFYADDGIIVVDKQVDLQEKLHRVQKWTEQNGILLAIPKCAVLTTEEHLPPLTVYGEDLPRAERYIYLGFPLSAKGIDFQTHLVDRIDSAASRSRWLGVYSNIWGPTIRLQIYRQFLAPMFEYGGPLIQAWALEDPSNKKQLQKALGGIKELMAWVTNRKGNRHRLTANLCGLLSLDKRLQVLKARFQLALEKMDPKSPLKQLMHQEKYSRWQSKFLRHLTTDKLFTQFKSQGTFIPTLQIALDAFLCRYTKEKVLKEGSRWILTSLIPPTARGGPGLRLADVCFTAPLPVQDMLLQYRRGLFMYGAKCFCDNPIGFHRGHEDCEALGLKPKLSRRDIEAKRKMRIQLNIEEGMFTDVDFLLNMRRIREAVGILLSVKQRLGEVFHKLKTEEESHKE
jgi:hypothetical protein